MASNYPPGVSGNKFAIAGPDYERETDIPCPRGPHADTERLLAEHPCEGFMIELGYEGKRWLRCSECECETGLRFGGRTI